MKVTPLQTLPEVRLLERPVFRDARGSFHELFRDELFAAAGIEAEVAQVNHSRSTRNVLRGLHYQWPRLQGKLVSVLRGEIFDVAVDVRRGSPTFGRWEGLRLAEDSGRALWIPPGFAHGFCVLSEVADVLYTCSSVYVAGDDRGVLWCDPALGIEWPVRDPILSARDAVNAPLTPDRTDLPEGSA